MNWTSMVRSSGHPSHISWPTSSWPNMVTIWVFPVPKRDVSGAQIATDPNGEPALSAYCKLINRKFRAPPPNHISESPWLNCINWHLYVPPITVLVPLSLWCLNWNTSANRGRCCWCPGFLHRQVINSHGVAFKVGAATSLQHGMLPASWNALFDQFWFITTTFGIYLKSISQTTPTLSVNKNTYIFHLKSHFAGSMRYIIITCIWQISARLFAGQFEFFPRPKLKILGGKPCR